MIIIAVYGSGKRPCLERNLRSCALLEQIANVKTYIILNRRRIKVLLLFNLILLRGVSYFVVYLRYIGLVLPSSEDRLDE